VVGIAVPANRDWTLDIEKRRPGTGRPTLRQSISNAAPDGRPSTAHGPPSTAHRPPVLTLKRLFDLTSAIAGLLVLSPLFLILALIIKLSDGGPVFYIQTRVGQGGRPFRIIKFRSMIVNAEVAGLSVTRDGDPRITRVGRFLRKSKLDELPQLWNVVRGEMSLVGPRPEVPRYVNHYTPEQRRVLDLQPGITDVASLEFRDEEELLSRAGAENGGDTEQFYLSHCVPKKIELNLAYAARANVWEDFKVVMRTVGGGR
jgi:lipopolysaccharide/colanic/teichoic acid biosynthesis glycosyltransferase